MQASSIEEFSDFETSERCSETPKIILATDARKLIRMESHGMLQTRKSQIVLDREIEKFKAQLEINRNLNKLQQTVHRRAVNRKQTKKEQCDQDFSMQKINIILDKVTADDPKEGVEKSSRSEKVNPEKISTKPRPREKMHLPQRQELQAKKPNIKIVRDGPKVDIAIEKPVGKVENVEVAPAICRIKTTHDLVKMLVKRLLRDFLEHYWSRWKLFVISVKSKREEEKKWREKINLFMKRANERGVAQTEKTASVNVVKGKPTVVTGFQNRKPISRSKAKTKDINQQNNEYKAMKEEINDSNENALQITKQINSTLNPKLKCKAKLMRQFTLEPKKESTSVSPINYPKSDIVVEMDRKHAERKQRMEALYEERRRMEEEKDRVAKEKYEQQILEAKMEKKRRLQEFQKKLRLERELEERKRIQWQRMKDMEEKAVQHYKRHLLVKIGLEPWLQLVAQRRHKSAIAAEYNETRMRRCVIRCWREHLQETEKERMGLAERQYTVFLMRTSIRSWKYLVTKRHVEMQVAEDWYDYLLARNTLQEWQMYTINQGIRRQEAWQNAGIHYKKKLLSKCIKYWMLFPQIIRLERSKEIRKNDWREKVQQVLPDFRPFIYAE